jgi:hypothetical protein
VDVAGGMAVPDFGAQIVDGVHVDGLRDAPLHGDVQGAGGFVEDDEPRPQDGVMAVSVRRRISSDSSCGNLWAGASH